MNNGLTIFFVFLVSAGLTWYLSNPASRLSVLDEPNERSLHKVAVPRSGGLAILLGVLFGSFPLVLQAEAVPGLGVVMVGATLIAIVSFMDDLSGVRPKFRFLVHSVAAVLVLAGGLIPDSFQLPGWQWLWPSTVSLILTALFLVWMTNLYNFMDGMDGFAGGMTVFGFGAYALLGWQAGEPLFTTASLIVAASAMGFLLFNFPPARIFMGDVGSSALGFLGASFSLWAATEKIFPIWVGILVFSPFIVDATVTLSTRLLAGCKVWEAHRSHYYQRLVRSGWGHRKTVLLEYALMIAAGLSANVAVSLSPQGQWILMMVWCFVYLGLGLRIRDMGSGTKRGG